MKLYQKIILPHTTFSGRISAYKESFDGFLLSLSLQAGKVLQNTGGGEMLLVAYPERKSRVFDGP
jgi:hypothetical protein